MALMRGFLLSLKRIIKDNHDFIKDTTPLHGSVLMRKLLEFSEEYEKLISFVDAVQISGLNSVKLDKYQLNNDTYLMHLSEYVTEELIGFEPIFTFLEKKVLFEEVVLDEIGDERNLMSDVESACHVSRTLNNLIFQITENNLKGCQILDLCLKFTSLSSSSAVIDNLTVKLHVPLSIQIKAWVLFGDLMEPQTEFFVKKVKVDLNKSENSKYSTFISDVHKFEGKDSDEYLNLYDYEIDHSLQPTHFPASLVLKILNIGKGINLLKEEPQYVSEDLNENSYGINTEAFLLRFEKLEKNFELSELENIINDINISLQKHLRKLCIDVGQLYNHHRIMVDIYLMQKGDLMRQFMVNSRSFLDLDAYLLFKRVFDSTFETSCDDLSINSSVYTDKLKFSLPSKKMISKNTEVISVLELKYKLPWPLHFIFSDVVMQKYNSIFIFLMRLKRAYMKHLDTRGIVYQLPEPRTKRMVIGLFNKLLLVFKNLQQYIFEDVINVENAKWLNKAERSETLDEITAAHTSFISNILYKLFFSNEHESEGSSNDEIWKHRRNSIHKEIQSLIETTNSFCELMTEDHRQTFKDKLDTLSKSCEKKICNFISLLHKINQHSFSECIEALLIRLDFNHFYSPRDFT